MILVSVCLCFILPTTLKNNNNGKWKAVNNILSSGPISPILIDDTDTNDWAWASTQAWFSGGSGVEGDPYVLKDLIIDGGGVSDCITIKNSNTHFKIQNCTVYNAGFGDGICLNNVSNGIIALNNCSNIYYFGISLDESCYNHIEGNFMDGNDGGAGINLRLSHNNTIGANQIKNKYQGIRLEMSSENVIADNTAEENVNYGILVMTASNHNTISSNTAKNQTFESGIMILNSEHNTVTENFVSDNKKAGIDIDGSSFNTVSGNTIFNNDQYGISIWTNQSSISSNENVFTENIIYGNKNGVFLYNASNNQISDNEITNNDQIGIAIGLNGNNTIITNNQFLTNGNHAIDNGANNVWDGNYWDNYSASDDNNDGIGDVPYDITGNANSKDFLPIWDDRAPIVEIIAPEPGLLVGRDAPEFMVYIYDPNLDKMWYTIDADNIPFSTNGTIDQQHWETLWDVLGQGDTITLTFYANDTYGHIGLDFVELEKEIPGIPSNGIGLNYGITLFFILIFGGISIVSIISKLYHKKQIVQS